MKALLMSGSQREKSINRRLIRAAAQRLETLGHEVDIVSPADLTAPLYDGDLEAREGVPDSIKSLNERMANADALIISTPEYNGLFPALLKNTLDWMSRKEDGQKGVAVFRDKAALTMAASPGARGGLRALPHLRTQLSNLGLNVFRGQLGVARAGSVLSDTGEITDETVAAQLDDLLSDFATFATRLSDHS